MVFYFLSLQIDYDTVKMGIRNTLKDLFMRLSCQCDVILCTRLQGLYIAFKCR